jgi:hypothetical protein
MYMVKKYTTMKKQWIKWKKMLNKVAQSDMKPSTLLDKFVNPTFEDNGLFDESVKF